MSLVSILLLLPKPKHKPARKSEAVLHRRAIAGSYVLRSKPQADGWRDMVIEGRADGNDEGIAIRPQPELVGWNAIGVTGKIAMRPASHDAS